MRTNRAAINIFSSAIYKIVALICGLIVPRLMLEYYGSEYNGIVASANQFMNYITILTIGIAGPTRVALYDSLAKGENNITSGILKATSSYMKKFSLTIILYALGIMFLLPKLAHTTLPNKEVAVLVGIVSISMFIEYFYTVTNHTLLSADQREYVFDISSSITVIVNCILIYVLVKAGFNIFIVKFCSSLVIIIKPMILSIYIKKNYDVDYRVKPDNSALKQRGAAAATSLANLIHDNIDLILLTAFVDIKLVSVYTVYNMIIVQIRAIMQIFTGSLEAGFGNIIAKKEYEALKRNFKNYEFLVFAFVSIVISCVFVLLVPFVGNYTKGVNDIDYIIPSFAFLITLCEATYCIRQPYVTLVQAAGRYKETRDGAILEAIINILLSIVLVKIMGFQGVVVGTIVANVIRSVQYCVYAYNNIIDQKVSSILGKLSWCLSNISIICICSYLMGGIFNFGEGWGAWVLNAMIVFLAASIVTISTGSLFFQDELKGVIKIIIRIVDNWVYRCD